VLGFVAQANAANQFRLFRLGWDITAPVLWVVVVGSLFQNIISYGADQAVVQRYLTTPDQKAAARAIWANAIIGIPGAALLFLLGSGLFVYYQNHPELLSPALKNDQVFPHFIAQTLPAGLTGLVIAGIFAATMSTLDSSLNSVSAAFMTDFYRRWRPHATEEARLRMARWLTVALGALAILVAFVTAANEEKILSLWDYYMKVLGLLMGCLTGVFILGIFTRRASVGGAWLGVVGGAAVLFYACFFTKVSVLLYAAIGITATFVIGYVGSWILPGRPVALHGVTIYTRGARDDEGL
jgi:Na+/proline symporter